jgi:hypothetical protein
VRDLLHSYASKATALDLVTKDYERVVEANLTHTQTGLDNATLRAEVASLRQQVGVLDENLRAIREAVAERDRILAEHKAFINEFIHTYLNPASPEAALLAEQFGISLKTTWQVVIKKGYSTVYEGTFTTTDPLFDPERARQDIFDMMDTNDDTEPEFSCYSSLPEGLVDENGDNEIEFSIWHQIEDLFENIRVTITEVV